MTQMLQDHVRRMVADRSIVVEVIELQPADWTPR